MTANKKPRLLPAIIISLLVLCSLTVAIFFGGCRRRSICGDVAFSSNGEKLAYVTWEALRYKRWYSEKVYLRWLDVNKPGKVHSYLLHKEAGDSKICVSYYWTYFDSICSGSYSRKWSPGGSRIACRLGSAPAGSLLVVNTETGKGQKVPGSCAISYAWVSDTAIAYSELRSDQTKVRRIVCVYDLQSEFTKSFFVTDGYALSRKNLRDLSAQEAWSPSGRYFAFCDPERGEYKLVDAVKFTTRCFATSRFAPKDIKAIRLAWQPDSKGVFFITKAKSKAPKPLNEAIYLDLKTSKAHDCSAEFNKTFAYKGTPRDFYWQADSKYLHTGLKTHTQVAQNRRSGPPYRFVQLRPWNMLVHPTKRYILTHRPSPIAGWVFVVNGGKEPVYAMDYSGKRQIQLFTNSNGCSWVMSPDGRTVALSTEEGDVEILKLGKWWLKEDAEK